MLNSAFWNQSSHYLAHNAVRRPPSCLSLSIYTPSNIQSRHVRIIAPWLTHEQPSRVRAKPPLGPIQSTPTSCLQVL